MQHFLLALGFLTRLAPARTASTSDMLAACRYFPLAGLVLGAVCILPAIAGLFRPYPAIQAWLLVLLHVYLTRGLHYDGLADLCDALGSGAQGDDFRRVLKDSRLGAFGAIAIALALCGQVIGSYYLLQKQALALLLFIPLLSRSLALVYSLSAPMHTHAALGKLSGTSPKRSGFLSGFICPLLFGVIFLPLPSLALILAGNALIFQFFLSLAKKTGGFNGDYLGALICSSETATPLFALCLAM